MANRVAGKIKLQSVDQLLGVPEIFRVLRK